MVIRVSTTAVNSAEDVVWIVPMTCGSGVLQQWADATLHDKDVSSFGQLVELAL